MGNKNTQTNTPTSPPPPHPPKLTPEQRAAKKQCAAYIYEMIKKYHTKIDLKQEDR